MKKQKHNIILILICFLTFISSIIIVIDGIKPILEIIKSSNLDTNTLLTQSNVDYFIDLSFAFMEIGFGVKLFFYIIKNKQFEAYKQIPGLIKTIVSSIFALIIADLIFFSINGTGEKYDLFLLLMGIYLFILIVSSMIRSAILKRSILKINIELLIISISSLIFVLCNFSLVFNKYLDDLNLINNILNTLILVLLSIFSIYSIKHYLDNPEIANKEIQENEDSEIIKTTEKYDYYKIYNYRSKNNPKLTNTLNFILGVMSVGFGIYFLFAFCLDYCKEFDIHRIIEAFKSSDYLMPTITYLINLIMHIIVPLVLIPCGISVIISVYTTNAYLRYNKVSIASVGYLMVVFSFINIIIDLAFSINESSFKELIKKYDLADLLLIIVFIGQSFISKLINNISNDVYKGLMNGDSYYEHNKGINILILVYSLTSILCVISYILKAGFDTHYLLIILIVIFLLNIVISLIEKKYPISEYTIAKRKKV